MKKPTTRDEMSKLLLTYMQELLKIAIDQHAEEEINYDDEKSAWYRAMERISPYLGRNGYRAELEGIKRMYICEREGAATELANRMFEKIQQDENVTHQMQDCYAMLDMLRDVERATPKTDGIFPFGFCATKREY
nr:MAG TPA: hypothetical protein [Caudoviricetes sp.]